MYFPGNYFYFMEVALQAFCVFHCLRKHNENRWIWIIVFLPLVGCLMYLFTEVFSGHPVRSITSEVAPLINPGGSVRKLEQQLQFSDTFQNRMALADAYLYKGLTEKAIELYEDSLKGLFAENEYGLMQLITAYGKVGRYEDIIPLAAKVYRSPQFHPSKAHILYAEALEQTGHIELAEKEYRAMCSRFSAFEARCRHGQFLRRAGRNGEARQLFSELVQESRQLNAREKRGNRGWFELAKEELKKMNLEAASS
jgi:hypothetical protein